MATRHQLFFGELTPFLYSKAGALNISNRSQNQKAGICGHAEARALRSRRPSMFAARRERRKRRKLSPPTQAPFRGSSKKDAWSNESPPWPLASGFRASGSLSPPGSLSLLIITKTIDCR
ncbi:hypothetical protein [Desulfobulbus sp.]|uniref:hypothetical protein n=1 Tax=Desulfobulbus sp. TaxID=895 RepID=UPI00286F3207|nr:hypothetical protein [Desulfobulbus sp.]